MVALVWFRKDLRIQDNPALFAAVQTRKPIVGIYIEDLQDLKPMGSAGRWWTHYALEDLQQSLFAYRIPLWILQGNPLNILQELTQIYPIHYVCWNRLYTQHARTRDEHIKTTLKQCGIAVESFNSSLWFEPWSVSNQQGNFFQVFTPFWKKCMQLDPPRPPVQVSLSPQESLEMKQNEKISFLKFLPEQPDWGAKMKIYWDISEQGAHHRLHEFLTHSLSNYVQQRDRPDDEAGTSRISPYLHHGQISPHQIWHVVQDYLKQNPEHRLACDKFLAELGWREFSYHLLYHMPDLGWRNVQKKFDHFPWQLEHPDVWLWQKGKTGVPIVDAGMRQLWRTGWMHNRVRMIVGSFLTKHMLIHWNRGEEWFWNTLVDADPASNAASWQWIAGCGADAAPYFRVFNPVLQGQKFDPEGIYVRKWIPELANCPTQHIHTPWLALDGTAYPKPIMDLQMGRERALVAYAKSRERTL